MQEQNKDLENVMRRIEKLLAIANDDRANPQEAAAAAGMAERIMRKYQFEHADIVLAALKRGDEMEAADCTASAKTNGTKVLVVPPWGSWLAVKVAHFNEVKAQIATSKDGEACIRFMGFKSDVTVAKWMFDYLVGTINRLCRQYKSHPEFLIHGRRAMNSYRQGVTTGILNNLAVEIAKKKEESAKMTSTGTSLMIVKAQAVAARYGEFKTKPSNTSVSAGSAFRKGVADGRVVSVTTKAVTGGGTSTLRIGN